MKKPAILFFSGSKIDLPDAAQIAEGKLEAILAKRDCRIIS
ncbi:MAG: hypothetical protein ACLPI9_07090 [Halobacteriota archaeon]|jgi:hypothetical protein